MPFIARRLSGKLTALETFKLWTKAKVRRQQGRDQGRCFLLDMPTELLLEIISYLSVAEAASLALTCRRLFLISDSILDSQSLRFNSDFAPIFHHYKDHHNFRTTRWQLIQLLEDSKWRACSNCLKLHPKAAFPSRELKRQPERRKCELGAWAGVVDLCPCKKITFRDKAELIRQLRVRQTSMNVLGEQLGCGPREKFCWHSCATKYGSSELNVKIYPKLDERDRLIVRTEYELSIEPNQLAKEQHMTPRFGCAHRSLDLWLSGICHSAYCHAYRTVCVSCRRISVCSGCSTVMDCARRRPYQRDDVNRSIYVFSTERCLGAALAVPDRDWAVQRIHPAAPSVDSETCAELCPWIIREHPPITWPPAIETDIIRDALDDQPLSALFSSIRMI